MANPITIDLSDFFKKNLFSIVVLVVSSIVSFTMLRSELDANKKEVAALQQQILSTEANLKDVKEEHNTLDGEVEKMNVKLDLLLKNFNLVYEPPEGSKK